MRSQVRFFMDAADERRFVDTVLEEPQTFLINGPHWKTPSVPVVVPENLSDAETYLMIWNKAVIPRLRAKRNNDYWEACNESTTIQFLRCRLRDEVVLTEGRIAVASDREGVERLYSRLRKIIQQTFKNQVICWFAPDAPRTAKNPSKPDPSCWVGPGALEWLRKSTRHRFKQDGVANVEGIECPGSAP